MARTKRQIKKAQRTRSQIARTFAALDNEHMSASDVLKHIPGCLYHMPVYRVVRRFPRMGDAGAENVLRHAKVWPLKKMVDLTPEERQRILAHLPPRARL